MNAYHIWSFFFALRCQAKIGQGWSLNALNTRKQHILFTASMCFFYILNSRQQLHNSGNGTCRGACECTAANSTRFLYSWIFTTTLDFFCTNLYFNSLSGCQFRLSSLRRGLNETLWLDETLMTPHWAKNTNWKNWSIWSECNEVFTTTEFSDNE